MEKTIETLYNFCNGRDSDDFVEVLIRHPVGLNKRKVKIFQSLAEPTGIFVGYNQRSDGAVVRVQIGDIRSAFRALQSGLTETVEFI